MTSQPDPPPASTGQVPGPVPERHASEKSPRLHLRGIAVSTAQLAGQTMRIMMHRLHPRQLPQSPVLLVVTVAAALTTVVFTFRLAEGAGAAGFAGQAAAWIWITVIALTSGEALAEARGRARAGNLRGIPAQPMAKLLLMPYDLGTRQLYEMAPAHALAVGEVVLVEAGDVIPADGEVIDGVAAVDESAVTGESAPVIRESGGDRSAVIGGTRVISDWLVVRVTARPSDSFYGHVVALIEAVRHRVASRQARLTLPLLGLALGVVVALAVLRPEVDDPGGPIVFLAALLAALMPTTTVGLLAAVAGMDRLVRANVIAKSGAAVDAAGTADTVLLDKTGTITFGGRTADAFLPLPGVTERELAEAAVLASQGDETPEGKSIAELGKRKHGIVADPADIREVFPFSAETRMSGARLVDGSDLRKGAEGEVLRHAGQAEPAELKVLVERVARSGGTPLAVARGGRVLGVVHLKDIVKPDLPLRFAQLAAMGIRTVMVTGDNPLTAATIAAEAGIDDYVAQASPDTKVALIRDAQARGHKVAMCGDGTNDAPALAQADLGIAMNHGTAAAREAGNMIDLDSDPFKLMEVIRVGRQLLRTRRALGIFVIAADAAKFLTVILAVLAASYPQLSGLSYLRLSGPGGAVLSTLIFSVVLILALVPRVLGGLRRRLPRGPARPEYDYVFHGLLGLVTPMIGIKLIDTLVNAAGFV